MDVNERRLPSDMTDTAVNEKKDKTTKKGKIRVFLKNVFFGLVYATCGYFLGGAVLPYGALPLGVAFLSASDRRIFYIYSGLVLSAISSERRILLIGVYTAILILRLITRLIIDPPWKKDEIKGVGERTVSEVYPYMFSEHIALRAALSAVGAFAIGVHRLIEGGLLYYDMYGTIIATVSAPAAVLLVSGFFSDKAKKYRRLVGFIALSFGVIYSIGDGKLYGISFAAFGCMLVTLYMSRTEGTVMGALTGAVLGLATGVSGAPLFAFSGLVSGLLFPVSSVFALCSALSVGVAWGIYTEGLSVLNGLLSALVSATLIFGMWDKLFLFPRSKKKTAEETAAEETEEKRAEDMTEIREKLLRSEILRVSENERAEQTEKRLTGLSEGLSSISELLYNMSRTLQSPCYSDLKQICDGAFENACCGCENRSACWKENYRETTDALMDVCSVLQRNGRVETEDVSGELTQKCGRLEDILSQINHNTYLHARQLFENDRTELFAADFEAVSELVRGYVQNTEKEYLWDEGRSAELERLLVLKGIDAVGACVLGGDRKCAVIFSPEPDSLFAFEKDISEAAETACGSPVGAPVIDRELGALRFYAQPRLSVRFAMRSMRAEGEDEFCGDTAGVFDGADKRKYAFISDGMGSGREAAMTSGLCGLFLRSLLSSGGGNTEGALKLLNGFLRNRGGGSLHECSSTVDLMEIDPYLCRASFYKSGAAPTYVFRNGSLFKLRSHTVPVGIIKELDFRKIDLELTDGDLVVMVSDGVTDGREECPWLFDLLRSHSGAEPDRLAELVVKYAKAEGATDDVTVIVLKPALVSKNS